MAFKSFTVSPHSKAEYVTIPDNLELDFPYEDSELPKEFNQKSILDTAEILGSIATKRVLSNPEANKFLGLVDDEINKLFSEESLEPYITNPTLEGYIKLVAALDVLPSKLPGVEFRDNNQNPYTNGLMNYARHKLAIKYSETYLEGEDTAITDPVVSDIALFNVFLQRVELQSIKEVASLNLARLEKRYDPAFSSVKEANALKVARTRYDTLMKSLFRTTSVSSALYIGSLKKEQMAIADTSKNYFPDVESLLDKTLIYLDTMRSKSSVLKQVGSEGIETLTSFRAGIRAEVVSYGYLNDLLQKFKTIQNGPSYIAFLKQHDPEGTISDLLYLLRLNAPKNTTFKGLVLEPGGEEFDASGIADFVIRAEYEPLDKTSTKEEEPIYISHIEVKTSSHTITKKEEETGITPETIFVGASIPLIRDKHVYGTRFGHFGGKTPPNAADSHVRDTHQSVTSLRIPRLYVASPIKGLEPTNNGKKTQNSDDILLSILKGYEAQLSVAEFLNNQPSNDTAAKQESISTLV